FWNISGTGSGLFLPEFPVEFSAAFPAPVTDAVLVAERVSVRTVSSPFADKIPFYGEVSGKLPENQNKHDEQDDYGCDSAYDTQVDLDQPDLSIIFTGSGA